MVRNWVPEAEREAIDRLVRKARLKGVVCAQWAPPPALAIHASMVDGSGTQSVILTSPTGRTGLFAGLLFGHLRCRFCGRLPGCLFGWFCGRLPCGARCFGWFFGLSSGKFGGWFRHGFSGLTAWLFAFMVLHCAPTLTSQPFKRHQGTTPPRIAFPLQLVAAERLSSTNRRSRPASAPLLHPNHTPITRRQGSTFCGEE